MNHAPESGHGEGAAVSAAQQPSAGREACQRERREFMVIPFDAEHAAFFVAGKGRRVEDDGVKAPALFREAAEPVEGVAFAAMMGGGVELVVGEIALFPVEVRLG